MSINFGLYGKLPSHGDFIDRDLARAFIEIWDDWLQRSMSDSRDLLSNQWLDHYLTSSIWRFALGHGVINSQCWVGILVPSVDSVGRYFPLTIAGPLPGNCDPFSSLCNNENTFKAMEDIAIEALQTSFSADDLWSRLTTSLPQANGMTTSCRYDVNSKMIYSNHENNILPATSLLYGLSRMGLTSASYWYASADSNCEFICQGLPEAELFSSMLSGQWR